MKSVAARGYEVIERVDAGTFGVVYRARQGSVGREVALKIIKPEWADHPEFSARFEAEAQLVARLEHPHMVPLYDFWSDEGGAYLAMRWVPGGSVKDALRRGPFRPEAALRIVEQVADALDTAHRRDPPRPQAGERPPRSRGQRLPHRLRHRQEPRCLSDDDLDGRGARHACNDGAGADPG